jgi:Raf kinase inhibitor-like YbhB/YbcL family protein
MRRFWLVGLVLIALSPLACKGDKHPPATAEKGALKMAMTLSSTAFSDGAAIPKKYSCEGEDVSPPLAWNSLPGGTKSLALILDDPDAPMGTWTHWVLWALPPAPAALPEGVPRDSALSSGLKQGKNSWPKTGYNGPCPPPGKPHRYYFKLYALDIEPALADNTNKAALESAIKDHILAQAQLMGTYGR